MNKAESVEPKTRHIRVVYEVIALCFTFGIWLPVPADSEDILRALVDGHHIRHGNAVLSLFLSVLIILNYEVNVHLK